MRVFRERLSICICASFPFGFEGRVWDLIVLVPRVPHYCLSIYFISLICVYIVCADISVQIPKVHGYAQ